jgi:hypothetical protein
MKNYLLFIFKYLNLLSLPLLVLFKCVSSLVCFCLAFDKNAWRLQTRKENFKAPLCMFSVRTHDLEAHSASQLHRARFPCCQRELTPLASAFSRSRVRRACVQKAKIKPAAVGFFSRISQCTWRSPTQLVVSLRLSAIDNHLIRTRVDSRTDCDSNHERLSDSCWGLNYVSARED